MLERREVIDGKIPVIITLPQNESREKNPVLILCHGSASSKDEVGDLFKTLASKLAEKDIASVRFDYAGGGERAEEPLDYSEAIQDTNRILEYVQNNSKYFDENNIGILGYSLGARFAIESVSQNMDKYKSVIIWSGACKDGSEQFGEFWGEDGKLYNIAKGNGKVEIPLEYRPEPLIIPFKTYEKFKTSAPLQEFKSYPNPILVVCGKEDEVVGEHSARDLAAQLIDCEFVSIEGGDHIYKVFSPEEAIVSKMLLSRTVDFANHELIRDTESLNISSVFEAIQTGNSTQELYDGEAKKSLGWNREKLQEVIEGVGEYSKKGKYIIMNGDSPVWLVSALTHALQPCPISICTQQSRKNVDIPNLLHGNELAESGVTFKVTENDEDILIEYNLDYEKYDENNLANVVVPEVTKGKAVYISGKGPNYLAVAVAEAYAEESSSVSLNEAGVGYICSISKNLEEIGCLIDDPLTRENLDDKNSVGEGLLI